MSQTNTNINNVQNWNQISRRGGRSQGGSSSSGLGDRGNDRGNNLITKYSFEGKIKDCPISKLPITKIGHKPSQFKKISDNLPVLCKDKTFCGLNEVIWTGQIGQKCCTQLNPLCDSIEH